MSKEPGFKPPPFFRPTEVELWNPIATFRQTKGGNIHRVSFEMTPELWELFKEPDSSLRLRGPLWRADDNESDRKVMQEAIDKPEAESASSSPEEKPKKEKKVPEPKGPYSSFWHEMFRVRKFFFDRDLWEVLRLESGDSTNVRARLHEVFEVESLSLVSPEQFIEWAKHFHLQRLADIADEVANAIARVAPQEPKV